MKNGKHQKWLRTADEGDEDDDFAHDFLPLLSRHARADNSTRATDNSITTLMSCERSSIETETSGATITDDLELSFAQEPRSSVRFLRLTLVLVALVLFGTIPFHFYFKMPSTVYPFLGLSLLPLPLAFFYLWTHRSFLLMPHRKTAQSIHISKARTPRQIAIITAKQLAVLLAVIPLVLWSLVTYYSLFDVLYRHLPFAGPVDGVDQYPTSRNWPGSSNGGTIFIAINLYNSASILPSMTASLLLLSSLLGRSNVHISIFESNSSDDTCPRLHDLGKQLSAAGIGHTIRCGSTGQRYPKELDDGGRRRIQFLATARNEAMKPLASLASNLTSQGRHVSKVMWINDVFFDPSDVLTLLNVAGGDFDQVCAIDTFSLGFYDTWVTRDVDQDRLKPMWPYFKRADDVDSVRVGSPVLVNSCWNGLTIFDAAWFMAPQDTSTAASKSKSSLPSLGLSEAGVAKAKEWNVSLPLEFRSVQPGACIASECLLSSFDQHLLSYPHRPSIYVHPRVVVSYDEPTRQWYRDWSHWLPVRVWSFLWQDVVATRLFAWVTNWGAKGAACGAELKSGWAAPDARLRRGVLV